MTLLNKLKRSWTIWFNFISATLAAAEMHFELLKAKLGEEIYGVALFVLILVNLALRFKTEMKHMKEREDDGKVV